MCVKNKPKFSRSKSRCDRTMVQKLSSLKICVATVQIITSNFNSNGYNNNKQNNFTILTYLVYIYLNLIYLLYFYYFNIIILHSNSTINIDIPNSNTYNQRKL